MFDTALSALGQLMDPALFIFLIIGVLAGLVMGIIPGLGGTGAVAVLLPFAFILDPFQALALIIGAVAVVHTSDTISAVLIGVPGSASSTVTLLDGHAMAKQGQAARALSTAFLSSMAGGVLGAIGLTLSIPIARPLVLAFGSPELFMLTVLGISLTAILSRGNMVRGLVAGALGVLLGQIGGAPAAADYRFTFGSLYLSEGLDLVAVALGVFGLAEVIHLVAKGGAVSEVTGIGGGWRLGMQDFVTHWKHVLRGALIGIWAGVLPGVGATAGAWMAYGSAVASSKDKSKFGKGDPRGIIGPESANNSVEAGDLIPTLLFGIPGGAPAALLMGALLVYGVEPGPRLITDHLDLLYVIVWSFAIASVLGAALCFAVSTPLAKLSSVPFPIIAAGLVVIMFVSAYQQPRQFAVLQVMLVLAALGWLMKGIGMPRAPFLIGFVLSIPMERYYYLTSSLYKGNEWMMRPGVLIMAAILIAPLLLALRRHLATSKSDPTPALEDEDEGSDVGHLEGTWFPAILAALFTLVFLGAAFASFGFSERAALMPLIVGITGAGLSALLFTREVQARRAAKVHIAIYTPGEGPTFGVGRDDPEPEWIPEIQGDRLYQSSVVTDNRVLVDDPRLLAPATPQGTISEWKTTIRNVAVAFAWLVSFVILVYILGTILATLIFIPAFLVLVAHWQRVKIAIYVILVIAALLALHQFAQIALPVGVYTPILLR